MSGIAIPGPIFAGAGITIDPEGRISASGGGLPATANLGEFLRWDGTGWTAFTSFLGLTNQFGGGELDLLATSSPLVVSPGRSPSATQGYFTLITAGVSQAVGARTRGGDTSISAGDAVGTTGAAAVGGDVNIQAGSGSTSSGQGGDTRLFAGNGGAPDGDAGQLDIGSGAPSGAGAFKSVNIWQGGIGANLSAHFDDTFRLHIGQDGSTGSVFLRVNGLTQATVGAAGAASALPALPLGYLQVDINGTVVVIPYYNAA